MSLVRPTSVAPDAPPVAVPADETVPGLAGWWRDRWLWLLLLVALALRLAIWWLAPHSGPLGDEREYFSAAAVLADGRGFSFLDQALWVRPPLYIVFLGALFRLFGPTLAPVWLAQVVLSVGSVGLVYLLGRLLYPGAAVARLAALWCALYLPFAVYTRFYLSETLFIAMLLGGYVALAWWRRARLTPLLAVAGVCLGLAVLTRGLALGFLAVLPLWFSLDRRPGESWRHALRHALAVVAIALAVVAPWTARNALVYHRVIPVETTGGYNFWLGALAGQDAGQVENALREIPNQGDRQSYALARGWDVVRANPIAYLAKSVRELIDLWRINFSAYERLTRGFTHGVVPAPWLGLTAVLDDLLYLAALPLAALGWALTRRAGDRWLPGLWIVFSALTGALFFAITRFRVPVLPFVFLFAARGAVGLAGARRFRWRPRRDWAGPLAVGLLAFALVYPTFAPDLYARGIVAAGANDRLERGYRLLAERRPADALALFRQLPADFYARPTALAAAEHALGDDRSALATLDDTRDPLGAALLRGAIARDAGDLALARASWNARDFRLANPLDLAWTRLQPPGLSRIDVGNGLDLGYVRGFNLDERAPDGTTFRWSDAVAEARLTPAQAGPAVLRLRLRSYRPAGSALSPVTVVVNGWALGQVWPGTDWRVYAFPVTVRAGQPVVARLTTRIFVPGYDDQRRLGVMVDWIDLAPAGGRP